MASFFFAAFAYNLFHEDNSNKNYICLHCNSSSVNRVEPSNKTPRFFYRDAVPVLTTLLPFHCWHANSTTPAAVLCQYLLWINSATVLICSQKHVDRAHSPLYNNVLNFRLRPAFPSLGPHCFWNWNSDSYHIISYSYIFFVLYLGLVFQSYSWVAHIHLVWEE